MPFQPGKSGNPNGRPPKGLALSDIICAKLEEKGENGKPNIETIVEAAVKSAIAGDRDARVWLADRGYGRTVEVPLEIIHRHYVCAFERPDGDVDSPTAELSGTEIRH